MIESPKPEANVAYDEHEIELNGDVRLSDIESVMKIVNQLLDRDDVTDLMINSHEGIYIEQGGKMLKAPFTLNSSDLVKQLAERLAKSTGKAHILDHNFVLDGMLPSGNRITIIMPPASLNSPTISIRRFPKELFTLGKMVERGLLTAQMEAFLKTAIERRANVLISGNTSSGKTTLMNALSVHIPPSDRLVTIEDTPEMQIQQENVVRLEIESFTFDESHRNIASARSLVKSALRIRPDRIIMGEIRGSEAFDFIQAINTGHKGSMATTHANTPRETITRMEHMVRMGVDLPSAMIKTQIASSLDILIQMYRNHEGVRRISHITEVVGMEGEVMVTHDHFVYDRGRNGELGYQWDRTNSRNMAIQKATQAAMEVK